MSRSLLALAIAAALSTTIVGCSSGGSDSGGAVDVAQNDDTADVVQNDDATDVEQTDGDADGGAAVVDGETDGDGDTDTPVSAPTAPSGGGAPSGDTKAGVYNGDLGFGDDFTQGVYVIDNEFNLAGIALAESGEARAIFGGLGDGDTYVGTLREYALRASQSTASDDVSFSVGGAEPTATPDVDLTFTNGNSIQGSETRGAALSIAQQPNPATFSTVAGTWTADNTFRECDDSVDDAGNPVRCRLLTELTFTADGTVTGETFLSNGDGSFTTYRNPIVGEAVEFGDALLINLNWGSLDNGNLNAYSGAAFFDPSTGERLIYAVEGSDGADPRALTAIMTRQP